MLYSFNCLFNFVKFQERDDLRRQLSDTKKDFEKQSNILQKCLAVNKKLLVEKVGHHFLRRFTQFVSFSRPLNENKHDKNVWRIA